MRKYLLTLTLVTFAFTVGIILFNGQPEQLASKPNLRSDASGALVDRNLQRENSEDTDDSGIIEGTTLDDNSSDEGSRNPYEPVIADPSGWSDVEGSADPAPVIGTDPVVEENAGTPEGEIEHIEEVGIVIPVEGPLEGGESDGEVTPGIVVEDPAPTEGSDIGDVDGRGVIEVEPVPEPEDPVGEGEVTEGEVIEVSFPAPPVTDGSDGGSIEVTEPVIIREPAVIETEIADPVSSGPTEPIPEPEIKDPFGETEIQDPVGEGEVTEGEVIEVEIPAPPATRRSDGGSIEVTEPIIISEPPVIETEVADPVGSDPTESVVEEIDTTQPSD